MFLHMSVILSTGDGVWQADTPWADTPLPGQTPLAGRHPPRHTPPEQTPHWQADTHLGETSPPPGRPLQRTVRILLECIPVLN